MPIKLVEMNADMKQAIIECLAWYYDSIYDGDPEPMWVDVMIEQYCADDGITDARDSIEHIQKEIASYRADMARIV